MRFGLVIFLSILALVKASHIVCPDKTSTCPSDSTCCQLQNKEWGCCPMLNAVCCKDHTHCCPEGSQCDTKGKRCVTQNRSVPMMLKGAAKKAHDVIYCPDGKSFCPSETTCCPLIDEGVYGCCPSPQATCCSDNLHCCPNGMTCDSTRQSCSKESTHIPWLLKTRSSTISNSHIAHAHKLPNPDKSEFESETIICPDGKSQCPQEATCCLFTDGSYGCCPTVRATCCMDHLHCCPEKMECDTTGERCISKHGFEMKWLKKFSSAPIVKRKGAPKLHVNHDKDLLESQEDKEVKSPPSTVNSDIICPDKRSKCPSGTTCCMLASGSYGCCPAPKATCCPDRLHCCPEGMECDSSGQRCISDTGYSTVWLRKFASTPIRQKTAITVHHPTIIENESELPAELRAVPCGENKVCPALTTCCKHKKHGIEHSMCCPLQNGVCCHNSCCPAGFQCYKGGKCEKHATRYNSLFY